MKPDIEKMYKVWDKFQIADRNRIPIPKINFEEIISAVFALGPFYYYFIDFSDMSISDVSSGITQAHGRQPDQVKHIDDILSLIHPDDIEFVAKAEEKLFQLFYKKIGVSKSLHYKMSYNFRTKCADGSYKLFNHQALVLAIF